MKKILLMALLAGVTSFVLADDMGNMPGMNMGVMGQNNGSMQNTNNPSVKSYHTRGIVEKITSDRHTATIDTDKIPGYMDAMTMDYPVLNAKELNGVTSGDLIQFTLIVSNDTDWIEGVQRTGHTNIEMTNSMPMQMNASGGAMVTDLGVGDTLPDEALTTEDGREIHFSDFRGKAVAFTFFYTRCPLPTYCPLMNRNFADARDLLLSMRHAPTNWEFLSVSFDPDFDTSRVLAAYGNFYRHGDSSHWLFASAPKKSLAVLAPALDLMVIHQGSAISHNLRTVVLDPQGRIFQQFDGNQWTPKQLAMAMMRAARE